MIKSVLVTHASIDSTQCEGVRLNERLNEAKAASVLPVSFARPLLLKSSKSYLTEKLPQMDVQTLKCWLCELKSNLALCHVLSIHGVYRVWVLFKAAEPHNLKTCSLLKDIENLCLKALLSGPDEIAISSYTSRI